MTTTKRNIITNLKLVPAKKTECYCRHCGEEVDVEYVSEHMLFCTPEIHDAIAREYNRKERQALQIAAFVE